MPVAENALEVFDPAKLLISHSDYAGKTPQEARQAIALLLLDYNAVISVEEIKKEKIEGTIGSDVDIPDYLQSYGQMDGAGLIRVYYDGTTNTGKIKNGHPVVLDTVKGNAVTGIHASWNANEYKIIGTALKDYEIPTVEGNRIPIRLQSEAPAIPVIGDYAIGSTSPIGTIAACDWNANGNVPVNSVHASSPEWTEGTGTVYLPKKKTNGKVAYESQSGNVKFYNMLPFEFLPSTLCWLTSYDGVWIIKRPVYGTFGFSTDANGGSLVGGKVSWATPAQPAVNLGKVAEVVSNTDITIRFPASLHCRILATVIVSCFGTEFTGGGSLLNKIRWRNDLTLIAPGYFNVASNHTIQLDTATSLAPDVDPADLIITHTFQWQGMLTKGTIVGVGGFSGSPSPLVVGGSFCITPLIGQP